MISATGTAARGIGTTTTDRQSTAGTALITAIAAGTAHGLTLTGPITVGQLHLAITLETAGTMDGGEITITGTALTMVGIRILAALVIMAVVTGTTIAIPAQ